MFFTTDLKKAVTNSDIIFICVGTPTKKNSNSADLNNVFKVTHALKKIITKYKIIVTKSTVPVTTGDEIEKILINDIRKKDMLLARETQKLTIVIHQLPQEHEYLIKLELSKQLNSEKSGQTHKKIDKVEDENKNLDL